MSKPGFTKRVVGVVINDIGPGPINTFSTVGDINGDGLPDIAICGRSGRMVWLENPGADRPWEEHLVDELDGMECGGILHDLTGNGRLDIVNGGDWRRDEIFWWENPGLADGKWTRRLIAKTGYTQFHDTIIGDVTNDGVLSLVFTNQHAPGGTTIYRVPLPEDPTTTPWPDLEVVASGKCEPNPYRKEGMQPEEGLAIGDIDGDGENELICGTHWYKLTGQVWKGYKFATGYLATKVAVADVNGDGSNEILLAEGDPCVYGKMQGGKVSWFRRQAGIAAMPETAVRLWEEHVLEDFLLDAHTLQLGDICGNGKLDILVGEVGLADKETDAYTVHPPRLIVFENDGKANFTRHVVDEGTGIHEGLLVDMRNRGVLDISGKPLHGPEKWSVHVWYNRRGGEIR
jgi:hypothetical protein